MEKEILKIPYVLHEATIFKYEQIIKKLVAAFVLSEVALGAILIVLLKKGGKGET